MKLLPMKSTFSGMLPRTRVAMSSSASDPQERACFLVRQDSGAYRAAVITGTILASEDVTYRKPIENRPTSRHIVVIRNGTFVGSQTSGR